MTKQLYTIGYAGFDFSSFSDTLRKNSITALIDVRSNPHSAYFPDFNKEQLERKLRCCGIRYRSYSKEFGAQQTNSFFYSPEGFLDFESFAKSKEFTEGFNRLEKGMEKDYVFALMCSEKNPIDCHRAIMISRVFSNSGYDVLHLLPRYDALSQKDIEEHLLEKYYPEYRQQSMFGNDNKAALIIKAYHKRNAEIGYRKRNDNKHDTTQHWIRAEVS